MLILHWPWNDVQVPDIEWMKQSRSAAGDLEMLSIIEPHKLAQSGCAIFRKRVGPPIVGKEQLQRAARSLELFMERYCGS